jgi:hypothetical protein
MINGRGHLQMFSHAYLDGALRGTDAFFIIIGFRRWHFGTPRQLYVRSRFSFFFFVVLSLSFGFGLLVVILSPGRRHNFVKWAPEGEVFDRGVREGLGADTSWLCKECTRDHRQARHTRCSYTWDAFPLVIGSCCDTGTDRTNEFIPIGNRCRPRTFFSLYVCFQTLYLFDEFSFSEASLRFLSVPHWAHALLDHFFDIHSHNIIIFIDLWPTHLWFLLPCDVYF